MKVVDAETGETFDLYPTEELTEDLRVHHGSLCKHLETDIRRVTIAGGAQQFRRQCSTCGDLVGQAIAKASAPIDIPSKDEILPERYEDTRKRAYQKIIQHHVCKQKEHSTDWWARYEAYLKTPEWRVKRDKVLKRAGLICEGCGDKPATQVHHQTYDHAFNEFLFELVALCEDCHKRVHARETPPTENEWFDGHPCDGCRWQDEQGNRRWCGKFSVYASEALSVNGDCGPKHAGLEPLK